MLKKNKEKKFFRHHKIDYNYILLDSIILKGVGLHMNTLEKRPLPHQRTEKTTNEGEVRRRNREEK